MDNNIFTPEQIDEFLHISSKTMNDLQQFLNQSSTKELDNETKYWLDTAQSLPGYDWGDEDIPKGKSVTYIKDIRLVIDDDK